MQSPYQFQSSPTGHYYLSAAPNYQQYIAPVGVQNSAHFNSATSTVYQQQQQPDSFRTGANLNTCPNHQMVAVPLTPNSSTDNHDGQLEDGSDNSQAGEKMGNENGADGSEVSQHLEPITTCN